MISDFDLAIVGSGFGGSLLAMVARRLGLSVLLVERQKHPRFAVGESTSPLTNLILEQIARTYDLPQLLPFVTFGDWQSAYPEIGCGLKRGFTYYKHEAGSEFAARPDRMNELLVAASPSDEVSDTHWFRADVDHFFQKEAVAVGAEYSDETEVVVSELSSDGASLILARNGTERRATCRLLVDATGPRGLIFRSLRLEEAGYEGYPSTQALFSHFTGVARTEDMDQFASHEKPPYAPDAAALHHVFDDGWMWVLRFGNGITSAGFSVTDAMAADLTLAEKEGAWRRFLNRYPTVREQFADAEPIREFTFAPRLAFRSSAAAGDAWAMLPSAAAFVDPLFSTGIPLTLIGIERLATILQNHWRNPALSGQLARYGALTLSDADWTAQFVGGCFAAMRHFQLFTHYSMYYFAAASYSEMARRIDRRDLASRFLLQNRTEFGAGLRSGSHLLKTIDRAPSNREVCLFATAVEKSVRSVNIAGLCDPLKRNWYDIDWNDLISTAIRLEMTPIEMTQLLTKADWANFP